LLKKISKEIQEETVKLLRSLVRIRSTNPPGDENQIAEYITEFLTKSGIAAQLVPLEESRGSVVGKIPGKEQGSIVLCGHLDTVGVNEERWTKPPFEGLIENGRLYGRGASDMKGGVAVILEAAKALNGMKKRPQKTLLLALTADEEREYRGAQMLTEEGFFNDAEFLIVTT